jgi:hypothetical protein
MLKETNKMNKIIKIPLIAILTGSIMNYCFGQCSSVSGEFNIDGWRGKMPKHGVLYRYKKGSNFTVIEKKYETGFIAELVPQPNPKIKPPLDIRFTGYNEFSTDSDYKLVLDNKIEYRIYDLNIFPDENTAACGYLRSGKVNQCNLRGFGFVFQSSCGEPVK